MGTCVTVRVRVTELSRGAPVILLKLFFVHRGGAMELLSEPVCSLLVLMSFKNVFSFFFFKAFSLVIFSIMRCSSGGSQASKVTTCTAVA